MIYEAAERAATIFCREVSIIHARIAEDGPVFRYLESYIDDCARSISPFLAMVLLATSLPSVGSDATVLAVGGCSDLPPFGRFERHTLRFRTV